MFDSKDLDIDNQSFVEHLQSEKINTQNERSEYVKLKLAFISTLLGFASAINEKFLDTKYIFYIIPVISIIFDNYIAAANASIKKIGKFLRENTQNDSMEKKWEITSEKNRDKYAPFANLMLSLVISIASVLMYIQKNGQTIEACIIFGTLIYVQLSQHALIANDINTIDNQ